MKTLENNKGMTLIEAMISAAILGFGVLATLAMIGYSYTNTRTGRDVTIANNLSRQILEDMKNVGYATTINGMTAKTVSDGTDTIYAYQDGTLPDPNKVNFATDHEVIKEQLVTSSNKVFKITVDAKENDPSASLCNVYVEVSWNSAGQPHSLSYRTYFNM